MSEEEKEQGGGEERKKQRSEEEGKEQGGDEEWKEQGCGEEGKEQGCGEEGKEQGCGEEGKEQGCGEERKEQESGERACPGSHQEVKLEQGTLFANKEAAMTLVRQFSESRKTQFVLAVNSAKPGKPLLYRCRHGKKRTSECTGKRVIQRTVKKDCDAFIRFYVRASGETVLTDFNVDHKNHAINQTVYTQDTAKADETTTEIIKQMMDGNCKIGNIKKALAYKNIYLTYHQIRYQIQQIIGSPMHEEKLAELIKDVREAGGNVDLKRFPDGKVQVLTITTAKMKRAYCGAKPTVVQIDTTFGLESSGYKLNAVLYRNPTTGKGEVVHLAFMADETADSYFFALTGFQGITKHSPLVILIDKVNTIFFK